MRTTADLCSALSSLGVQVTVLTTNADGKSRLALPPDNLQDVDGVIVIYYPLTLGGLGAFYSRYLSLALRSKVAENDLVVSQTLWGQASDPLRRACLESRVPYVVQLHGQLQPWALAHKSLKKKYFLFLRGRKFLNDAVGLHCTDDNEARSVQNLGFRAPTFVVPNGLNLDPYHSLPHPEEFRQKFTIPDQAIVLLLLGRLTAIKRPDLAIAVCAGLQGMDRPVHLILAGPGEPDQVAVFQSLAKQAGIAERVHFTGLLTGDQVLEALATADLFLMPSEVNENFGMSALEALAAGVPILVSPGIPVGRYAVEAGAGKVVPCEPDALTRAAAEMLADPHELCAMGKRGQELAFHKFGMNVIARQMLAECQSIITTGKPQI